MAGVRTDTIIATAACVGVVGAAWYTNSQISGMKENLDKHAGNLASVVKRLALDETFLQNLSRQITECTSKSSLAVGSQEGKITELQQENDVLREKIENLESIVREIARAQRKSKKQKSKDKSDHEKHSDKEDEKSESDVSDNSDQESESDDDITHRKSSKRAGSKKLPQPKSSIKSRNKRQKDRRGERVSFEQRSSVEDDINLMNS